MLVRLVVVRVQHRCRELRPCVAGHDVDAPHRPHLLELGMKAFANQDEAVAIVLENDETGAQTENHQKRMMGEIAKLIDKGGSKGIGYLDPADHDRTVKVLLAGGSDPVISKPPQGSWSHAVWDAQPK